MMRGANDLHARTLRAGIEKNVGRMRGSPMGGMDTSAPGGAEALCGMDTKDPGCEEALSGMAT